MARHDYYDPDHAYRSRRYQRASDRERPYAQRPMPGEHADRQRDRRITRQQADEEHAWSEPAAWYGEGRHRGVGPKGYVRSDERIRELVCDDLMDDPLARRLGHRGHGQGRRGDAVRHGRGPRCQALGRGRGRAHRRREARAEQPARESGMPLRRVDHSGSMPAIFIMSR